VKRSPLSGRSKGEPSAYADEMAKEAANFDGASQFTAHIETAGIEMSCERAAEVAGEMRAAGMMAGIALAP